MSAKLLLNSWKEIASFVGRSERTVQRWEKMYGFPVCRPAGRQRSAVIALASKIEAWTIGAHRATGETTPLAHETTSSGERPSTEPELVPTVLCIDCHSQRLEMRKLVMELNGYRVLTALGIRSGLRLFNNNQVDVVILESPMHPLDSDSIARQLHRSRPEVPILILSRKAKQIPEAVLNLISAPAQERPLSGMSPETFPLPMQILNSNAVGTALLSGDETRKNCAQHQETSDTSKSATSLHDFEPVLRCLY